MLNEGLEILGTDEYGDDGKPLLGVFYNSAVENVVLPSTLKRIEYSAFKGCTNLKSVELPSGLERLGT